MAQPDAEPAADPVPADPAPAVPAPPLPEARPPVTCLGMHALWLPQDIGDFGDLPDACAVLIHDGWSNGNGRTCFDVIELKGLDTWPWSAGDAIARQGMAPPGPMTAADARGVAALLVRAAEVVEQRLAERGDPGPGYRPPPRASDPKPGKKRALRLSRAG